MANYAICAAIHAISVAIHAISVARHAVFGPCHAILLRVLPFSCMLCHFFRKLTEGVPGDRFSAVVLTCVGAVATAPNLGILAWPLNTLVWPLHALFWPLNALVWPLRASVWPLGYVSMAKWHLPPMTR